MRRGREVFENEDLFPATDQAEVAPRRVLDCAKVVGEPVHLFPPAGILGLQSAQLRHRLRVLPVGAAHGQKSLIADQHVDDHDGCEHQQDESHDRAGADTGQERPRAATRPGPGVRFRHGDLHYNNCIKKYREKRGMVELPRALVTAL